MAIDAAEKANLKPNSDGGSVGNFGINFTATDYPTNAAECKESLNVSTQIDKLVGKVSFAGCNQSQLPSFGVGGVNLGKQVSGGRGE